MKNKEFQKLLKKNKFNSNSGFTLTELLVGLFMSIFVIGALGFGLITVLQATQRENSKAAARTENSRALDFISDELRRTRNIETDATNARTFDASGKTVVLALDIPEISEADDFDTDNDASTTNERIVYYLKSTDIGNWKGPQVLYRWGPPLNANGEYTNGTWVEQALIDGINDTTVTDACIPTGATTVPTGTIVTPATPQGFYACVSLQDSATAYDADDNPNTTAQLFLTGQTQTIGGLNDTQTNDSQVVTRARAALGNRTDENSAINWDVESLGGDTNCKPPTTMWDIQTDFTNEPGDPSKTTTWIQQAGVTRQAQPIEIDSSKPLTMTSSATGHNPADCLNDPNAITHRIDFEDPRTFNGNHETDDTQNNSQVGGGEVVQFFKKGFDIDPNYGGYDVDDNNTYEPSRGDQRSLGQFLYDKGLAIPVSGDPDDIDDINTIFRLPTSDELDTYLQSPALDTHLSNEYSNLSDVEKALFSDDVEAFKEASKKKFKTLGDDQRIIGFEMGQTDTTQAGFDLQDNIFVVTSSKFKEKFPACAFSGSCPTSDDSGTDSGSEYSS